MKIKDIPNISKCSIYIVAIGPRNAAIGERKFPIYSYKDLEKYNDYKVTSYRVSDDCFEALIYLEKGQKCR